MQRCACAVLWRDGQILLGRRSAERRFYPDRWDLVGGHVEAHESLERALARELHEELGVTPTEFVPIDVLSEPDEATHGAHEYHVYLVTKWEGTPTNAQPAEHSDVTWFPVAEAAQLDLAHPDYPDLFRRIAQLRRSPP
jgi:8-oxo-dGTP pyrophosphatase MutT (NUDIX family)